MRKVISILGSTGSIGLSTLNIIDKKKFFFEIYLLSANKNFKLICHQIKKYKPKIFVITDPAIYKRVKNRVNKKIIILNNFDKLNLNKKNDICISAIPGLAGLQPTLNIISQTKKLLIANKEAIICGWLLIKKECKKNKTKIVPVDSEHFSILKLLNGQKINDIKKIYITASGGPFFKNKLHLKKNILPKDALKHPNWKMGKKITIDSSNLMNKILEFIEAQKLFNITNKKLDIIIHPESLVHAIIELKNGLLKFIYHETSMIIPLANAIFDEDLDIKKFYEKKKNDIDIKSLTFKKPDPSVFPILKLKKRSNEYPSTSIIINASNEVLVDHFLNKKLHYLSISKIIMAILNDRNYKKYAIRKPKNINQIYKIDMWARNTTLNRINKK